MDHRLVCAKAPGRRAESVLRSGKSARQRRGGKLRPLPAADQNSPQSHQRWLASVRAELLPPLPSGRAPCGSGGYVDEPSRIPMCRPNREQIMSRDDNQDKPSPTNGVLNRGNILLGGTTLAAASAIATGDRVQVAQAQQPAARS